MQAYLTGRLIVKAARAKLTRDTEFLGLLRPLPNSKMDPYVKIQLGNTTFRTKTHKDASKLPSWFDVFEFKRATEQVLEFHMLDEDVVSDDLVGSGVLSLENICVPCGKKFSDSIKLTYKGKGAGELFVEVDFYPDINRARGC
eukprot:TRINITY_DN7789_c0_g3_i2.p1 TRINITY_DN7789_c0_g3~~TRINITY_DN7789_c0_g3_i2.p1  ORF type:complete len:143 (-),score=30.51 TRINITY_DN7789_c0_g3_i2:246-674(-)